MLEALPSMHDVKEEQQAPITSGVDSGQAKMAPLDRENKSFKTLHGDHIHQTVLFTFSLVLKSRTTP